MNGSQSMWMLEVCKLDEWRVWSVGTLDEILSDYYYHSHLDSEERWRLTSPARSKE